MSSENGNEKQGLLVKPFRHIGYISDVLLCVGFNLGLMVVSYIILAPSFDSNRLLWFQVSISVFVPIFSTFFICLLASLRTQSRVLISPTYVTLFTGIPALVLGSYVEYSVYYYLDGISRMNNVFAFLFLGGIAFLLWIYLSIYFSQPVIRNLIGAYADRSNIQDGTTLYQTPDFEHILEKIENKKWLTDLCSLRVFERKEDEDEIKLKFNKYSTNFYLSVYGKKVKSECYVALTHFQLFENLAEKVIVTNNDSRECLRPQIVEFEKSLNLKSTSVKKDQILYPSLNYAMAPARFPMLLRYRNQIITIAVTSLVSGLVGLARFMGGLDNEIFLGILAIVVALGSGAFTIINKK